MTKRQITLTMLCCTMAASLTSCNNTTDMTTNQTTNQIIVAHRGGASLGAENSLSCIQRGIEAGADMVEIDVHMTKDGEIVVCHDQTLNRTTTGKGKIEKHTLSEILQCRLLDDDGKPTDECTPTLAQVLDLCKGRTQILLEIKKRQNQYVGIEQKCYEMVRERDMLNDVVFQSFNDEVIFTLHNIDSTLMIEKLLFCRIGKNILFDGGFRRLSAEKYEMVQSFNIFNEFCTHGFIEQIHGMNKQVKVWTVDSPIKAKDGVDGIITNCPQAYR